MVANVKGARGLFFYVIDEPKRRGIHLSFSRWLFFVYNSIGMACVREYERPRERERGGRVRERERERIVRTAIIHIRDLVLSDC